METNPILLDLNVDQSDEKSIDTKIDDILAEMDNPLDQEQLNSRPVRIKENISKKMSKRLSSDTIRFEEKRKSLEDAKTSSNPQKEIINKPVILIPTLIPVEYIFKSEKYIVNKFEIDLKNIIKFPNNKLYTIYYFNKPFEIERFWHHLTNSLDKTKDKIIIIDTERDIINSKKYPYPLARIRVMSICTNNICFVISFSGTEQGFGVTSKYPKDKQSRYILPKKISELLNSGNIVKVGISLDEELLHLNGTFVNEDGSNIELRTGFDLQTLERVKSGDYQNKPSLQTLCQKYLKTYISNDERVTKWNVNELSKDQIIYSALDSIFSYLLKDLIL